MLKFLVLATVTLLSSTAMAEPAADDFHDELTVLSVGSFSTLEQARRDERYGVAEAEIVQIWPEQPDDEIWLYQEQALLGETADAIDPALKQRPYFARVIKSLEIEPGLVMRTIHKLKEPGKARGAWRYDKPLANMSPDDLEPSECAIAVTRIAEKYWRSESEKCPNTYKGAAYALSLGIVTDGEYANWDRGFSVDGRLIWGPASGGYIFTRKGENNEN